MLLICVNISIAWFEKYSQLFNFCSTSIQFFSEVCIQKFMDLEESLYKDPSSFSEYVAGVQETVNSLGDYSGAL